MARRKDRPRPPQRSGWADGLSARRIEQLGEGTLYRDGVPMHVIREGDRCTAGRCSAKRHLRTRRVDDVWVILDGPS